MRLRLQFVYWRLDRMESKGVALGHNMDEWSNLVDEQSALENALKGDKQECGS